jgi:microsomal dipeptidase-like Zn-dependent dipeptidase
MIKNLQKFYKELTYEQLPLFCEALDALEAFDSIEKVREMGALATQEINGNINNYKTQVLSFSIKIPAPKTLSLIADIEERTKNTQLNLLSEMANAASIKQEFDKLTCLKEINVISNFGLTWGIHDPARESIPMIFAVFSRKNDYYGLGSQGTDTTDDSGGGGGRTL